MPLFLCWRSTKAKESISSYSYTFGSVSGTLKPPGRIPRPGLKISAMMIAATAAAATAGAIQVSLVVIGGAAAAGYALAASEPRCMPPVGPGRRC
jgi:hypothetical protein